MEEKDILVHACCGPCSTSSIERLLAEGWHPTLYFRNDNIFPEVENDKRYGELEKVAAFHDLPVIRDRWHHELWREAVSGLEKEREGGRRCEVCFAYTLRQAAEKARKLGFLHFCTTLTVSRFKNSPRIFRIGNGFDGFEPIDFKKKGGFERSIVLSREMGLYRQRYCGCEFSLHSDGNRGPDSSR